MSKADEMFDELGTYKSETKDFISYRGKINKNAGFLFNKKERTIILEGFNAIVMHDLQAINEKIKELGWLDE
jgi:hypothetical protein